MRKSCARKFRPGTLLLVLSSLTLWWLTGTFLYSRMSSAQLIRQAAPAPGPAIGRAAIAIDLQDLESKEISLETYRGKPLVVNFFASWCDPCREEMPLINGLASAGAKAGFNVLGIAVEDTRAAVTEYRKEAKLIFPIALDLNSKTKRAYRIFGPPATFFIDGQSVIRDMVIGPITPERAKEAMRKIGIVTVEPVPSVGP